MVKKVNAGSVSCLHLTISCNAKPQQDLITWFGALQRLIAGLANMQFSYLMEQFWSTKLTSLTFHSQTENALLWLCSLLLWWYYALLKKRSGVRLVVFCRLWSCLHGSAHSCTMNFHARGLHKCRQKIFAPLCMRKANLTGNQILLCCSSYCCGLRLIGLAARIQVEWK